MSCHFNQHVPKHLFNLSDQQRASYVKDQNPVLLGLDTFGTERWAYCTICRKGRFFYIRGHKDFSNWAKKHKDEGCGKLWNKVAVLFEAPEPPPVPKEPVAPKAPVKDKVPVEDTAKVKELEDKIKDQDEELEEAYDNNSKYSKELELIKANQLELLEALRQAEDKAERLPKQAHNDSDRIWPDEFRLKVLAIVRPLFNLATSQIAKQDGEEPAKEEEEEDEKPEPLPEPKQKNIKKATKASGSQYPPIVQSTR